MEAAVRNDDVGPLVVGDGIHDVAPGAEELQHRSHRDGGSPRLEEGLGGQEQYSHVGLTGVAGVAAGAVAGVAAGAVECLAGPSLVQAPTEDSIRSEQSLAFGTRTTESHDEP